MSEIDANGTDTRTACPALEQAARPDLYRRNAFRVAGVPVEASARDISRYVERLQLVQRLGARAVDRAPLVLVPPPDEHAVRAALHDLNDPERRLIDEVFWFWPLQLGQTKTDRALRLLHSGDIQGAAAAWAESENGSEAFVSTHNLAVLAHCLALDLESECAKRSLSAAEQAQLERYWEDACRRWAALIHHEGFWSRLSDRIRSLEDPRLTTGFARRVRRALPTALLAVNAALAVQAAENGDMAAAKRQIDIMRRLETSALSETASNASAKMGPATTLAMKRALAPLRKRLRSLCEDVEAKVDADPVQGEQITRTLVHHTAPWLAVFDALLGPGDATRDAVRDDVAMAALRCQIPFGNNTENWRASLSLLELIRPIAASGAALERIDDNLVIVRKNVEVGSCWFCGENDAIPGATHSVAMHGDVNRQWAITGTRLTWRQASVPIPRCSRCQQAHSRSSWSTAIGVLIGLAAGAVSCAAGGGGAALFVGIVGALAGWAIGAGVAASQLPSVVKPESYARKHPRVIQLLAIGWSFGDRPSS